MIDKGGSSVQELISQGNRDIVSSRSVAVLLSGSLEHLLGSQEKDQYFDGALSVFM